MDKVVISPDELAEIRVQPQELRMEAKLPSPIPIWAKVAMSALVLVLPLLCLVAIILRVAFRTQPPRTRYAWTGFLCTLLVVSGLITSVATAFVLSVGPLPAIMSSGLSELDEKSDFPALPAKSKMSATQVSEQLRPLVAVITPAHRNWFSHQDVPSAGFGAGVLLRANSAGYLFATAKHVADFGGDGKSRKVLVSMASGVWANAEVIARHTTKDLALIWMPRLSGEGEFTQPISEHGDVVQGESIYVIGHPEGLKFALSSGIVSRVDNDTLQISAPISPGNSGGPVYDDSGKLVGIVSYTMDKSINPNAENLNFAVGAGAFVHESGWEFLGDGRTRLLEFQKASLSKDQIKGSQETGSVQSTSH